MSRSTSQNLWEPYDTEDSIVGETVRLGGRADDLILFYVDSTGSWTGNAGTYKPVATDVTVVQFADSGPLDLQLVLVSGAIVQGTHLTWTGVTGEVIEGGAGDWLAGVALQDATDNQFIWMAIAGSVNCLVDAGGSTAGNLLLTAASGAFDETGADATNAVILAEETVASGLGKCRLLAQPSV